jgi:hypothetical protein
MIDPALPYPARVRAARDLWTQAIAAQHRAAHALSGSKRARADAAEAAEEALEAYLREARTLGPDERHA